MLESIGCNNEYRPRLEWGQIWWSAGMWFTFLIYRPTWLGLRLMDTQNEDTEGCFSQRLEDARSTRQGSSKTVFKYRFWLVPSDY